MSTDTRTAPPGDPRLFAAASGLDPFASVGGLSVGNNALTDDPFADLEDQEPSRPADVRAWYLARARKGYADLHRDWIQLPKGTKGPRGSALARLVTTRRENALEAFLLLHALQPVLQHGQPLAMDVWAAMMTRTTRVTHNAASKAFADLVDMRLVHRRREGRLSEVAPLAEDGSGAQWADVGTRTQTGSMGQGYFTFPFAYWLDGYSARLRLPGKAMLLILLADTQVKQHTNIPIEKAQDWYGVSERTAERGYNELKDAGLLLEHRQRVSNPEVPGGHHFVYHRALAAPFSTIARTQLRREAKAAGEGRRGTADTSSDKGGGDNSDDRSPDADAAKS